MLGYLFVAKGKLDWDGIEGSIHTCVFVVFARFGTLAEQVHTLYLADEVINHFTCQFPAQLKNIGAFFCGKTILLYNYFLHIL